MSNLELLSVSCSCCGAKLDGFQGKEEVKCDFCDNVTRIIRPVSVNISEGMDSAKTDNFNNLIKIMEQSMIAENYKEAYDYCNKALEIDPSCGTLWENKAICCFWLRTDNDIIESQAKEITTYLNAAKNNDPNSATYESTASNLAFNLYFAAWYRYTLVGPDVSDKNGKMVSFSWTPLKKMVAYIGMMELAFDMSPNEMYLTDPIKELSNLSKARWIEDKKGELINLMDINKLGTNPVKLRERLITKMKKINPNYEAPALGKKAGCFIATAAMGSYDHPLVVELRLFRDNWILQQKWGKSFVNWYYTYGAIAAKFIDKSIVLKKISYILIVKPLYYISKLVKK
jgi:hypothetical protein